jgi:UDP-2,4-diacetamido-2,4,6-trideoxy-beta-L-altropyranose hydrolase
MSTGPCVVFRVDESSQVGFGHMSRCRALADALLKANAQVSFWCSKVRNVTRAALEHSGVTVVDLMTEEAFFQRDWRDTVVVVDGYQFNEVFWQGLLAARPQRTVCIDDFRGVPYLADIVVCNNEGVEARQFQLAQNTRLFLGGRYLLLRPEILAAVRLAGRPAPRSALMIVAGGTCQEHWVDTMLAHMAHVASDSPLWVLSGRRLPAAKVLYRSKVAKSQVHFFSGLDASAMLRRYSRVRCLIAPASTVMLEAFAIGCPLIAGWIADNQRNSLDFFDQQGLIANAGDLRHISRSTFTRLYAKTCRQSSQMKRQQRAYIQNSKSGIHEIVSAILAVA